MKPGHTWAAIVGVMVVCLLGAAALFAGNQAAESVAVDALVQARADDVAIAAWTAKNLTSQAVLVSEVERGGALGREVVDEALREAALSYETLDRSISSLAEVWTDATGELATEAANVAALARTVEGSVTVAPPDTILGHSARVLDDVIAHAVAVRDARASRIAAAGDRAGRVASAARWLVALLLPGLILSALYRHHRDEAQRHVAKAGLARERGLMASRDRLVMALMHHVRTPLTAVLGFSEILRERRQELSAGERNEIIEVLADEATELDDLIEDLRVAAVADPHHIAVESAPCDVRRTVEAVALGFGPQSRDVVRITGHGIALADPLRLRQVLRNLLRNALTHQRSRVAVDIGSGGGLVAVTVVDDGPGLSAGAADYMYSPYDSEAAPTIDLLSIGVGLQLSRRLAAAMGGELTYARSEISTSFKLTLPASDRQIPVAPGPDTSPVSRSDVIEAITTRPPRIALQPVIDVAARLRGEHGIRGFEALSRFPKGSPPDWFGSAALVGLDTDLETVAIREAVSQFASLRTDTFLAVNVSLPTLLSTELLELVEPLPPSQVIFELTENAVVSNYMVAEEIVHRLQRLGYRVALDDVGSEEVDLWHVLRLAPDVIKLDISLTRGLGSAKRSGAIIEAMVVFGRRRGAMVIAEGVETENELAALHVLGVPWVQGYLVGRPQLPDTDEYEQYVGAVATADLGG